MAYIAKYSPRVGARSARWEDDISPEIKSDRFNELTEILRGTSRAHNDTMVGKKFDVLVDREDARCEGALSSRTEGKLLVRVLNAPKELIGTFQTVEITEAAKFSLTGVICSD